MPVSDLLRLRHVLVLRVKEDRPAGAPELLGLVDTELARRSASPEGIIPPRTPIGEEPRPEAG
ncbi:MAG: hypothetical protein ACLGIS_09920 [Actinomycetes bacterium]